MNVEKGQSQLVVKPTGEVELNKKRGQRRRAPRMVFENVGGSPIGAV